MRFAIMECVVTPGGHEIDFDRLLVEELTALGHTVEFYVPEGHEFKWNYGVPVHHIPGCGVSYRGAHGLKKLILAARRELHRQSWYKSMYVNAVQGNFDAIIFPSATYRYLRALKLSSLKNSPVPVLFLIHGATPAEAKKLTREARAFDNYPNIRIGMQTFAAAKLDLQARHLRIYNPPNYLPRDIDASAELKNDGVLRLGFFGQYRREKNLEALIEAYLAGKYDRAVKLIVQGSTQTQADADDFDRIIAKYSSEESIEFWHRPLIGIEWQKGLASVDAIVIPYGNERYLYHTSAIISNAMGYKKPVIIADNVNPEIIDSYNIGIKFKNGDMSKLTTALESFINGYDAARESYEQELARAYEDFSPRRLAENIVALASE